MPRNTAVHHSQCSNGNLVLNHIECDDSVPTHLFCRSRLNRRRAETWPTVLAPSATWNAQPRLRRAWGKYSKWPPGRRCKSARGRRGAGACCCKRTFRSFSRMIPPLTRKYQTPQNQFLTKQHKYTGLYVTFHANQQVRNGGKWIKYALNWQRLGSKTG